MKFSLQYFYGLKDIQVFGECECYGFSRECSFNETLKKMVCNNCMILIFLYFLMQFLLYFLLYFLLQISSKYVHNFSIVRCTVCKIKSVEQVVETQWATHAKSAFRYSTRNHSPQDNHVKVCYIFLNDLQ